MIKKINILDIILFLFIILLLIIAIFNIIRIFNPGETEAEITFQIPAGTYTSTIKAGDTIYINGSPAGTIVHINQAGVGMGAEIRIRSSAKITENGFYINDTVINNGWEYLFETKKVKGSMTCTGFTYTKEDSTDESQEV